MSENQSPRHVVSITTGCHSTYLLLRMVEEEMPIDAVLFADTGMEFPEAYEHLWRLDQWLYQERGIHITCLKHPHSFEYMLLKAPIHSQYQRAKRKRLGIPLVGNGWPRSRKRWCCREMIDHVIDQEICRMEQESSVISFSDLAGQPLIIMHKGHSPVNDRIRADVEANHPEISIVDIEPSYDVQTYNRCVERGCILLSLECWDRVHPDIKTIPLQEDYVLPFGIVYSAQPSALMESFITAVRVAVSAN